MTEKNSSDNKSLKKTETVCSRFPTAGEFEVLKELEGEHSLDFNYKPEYVEYCHYVDKDGSWKTRKRRIDDKIDEINNAVKLHFQVKKDADITSDFGDMLLETALGTDADCVEIEDVRTKNMEEYEKTFERRAKSVEECGKKAMAGLRATTTPINDVATKLDIIKSYGITKVNFSFGRISYSSLHGYMLIGKELTKRKMQGHVSEIERTVRKGRYGTPFSTSLLLATLGFKSASLGYKKGGGKQEISAVRCFDQVTSGYPNLGERKKIEGALDIDFDYGFPLSEYDSWADAYSVYEKKVPEFRRLVNIASLLNEAEILKTDVKNTTKSKVFSPMVLLARSH